MAAYLIADIQITDPAMYEEYRALVPATVEKYGGRFRVRGGHAENLEGDWNPNRVVVLEFDSMDRLKEWYNSPEYSAAREIRFAASSGRSIVVEGA